MTGKWPIYQGTQHVAGESYRRHQSESVVMIIQVSKFVEALKAQFADAEAEAETLADRFLIEALKVANMIRRSGKMTQAWIEAAPDAAAGLVVAVDDVRDSSTCNLAVMRAARRGELGAEFVVWLRAREEAEYACKECIPDSEGESVPPITFWEAMVWRRERAAIEYQERVTTLGASSVGPMMEATVLIPIELVVQSARQLEWPPVAHLSPA